jgi:hypothetical protein
MELTMTAEEKQEWMPYTPGPWQGEDYCLYGPDNRKILIATFECHDEDEHKWAEQMANIHLIHAAPELREALEDLHRYNQKDPAYQNSPEAAKVHVALERSRFY